MSKLAVVTGTHRFPADLAERATRRPLAGPRESIEVLDLGDIVLANRHGLDERMPVHRVDHARNMCALAVECDQVLAIGSAGGLRVEMPPGTTVVPDDVFAPWSQPSMFDDASAEAMHGFDLPWRADVVAAVTSVRPGAVPTGTYVQSPGPRFETPAEVRFYATVGDVIGMTLGSEMVAASEAGLRYAAIVVVDNLANGVDAPMTTLQGFHAAVEAQRDRLWVDVIEIVRHLGHEL